MIQDDDDKIKICKMLKNKKKQGAVKNETITDDVLKNMASIKPANKIQLLTKKMM